VSGGTAKRAWCSGHMGLRHYLTLLPCNSRFPRCKQVSRRSDRLQKRTWSWIAETR